MAGQLDLIAAIVRELRLDVGAGGLAQLTTHDASNPAKFRIARDMPDVKGNVPFIGVSVMASSPLMGADVTHIQKSRINLKGYSADEVLCMKLLDRLEHFAHATASDANRGFYAISSADVRVMSLRFAGRNSRVVQDAEIGTWSGSVVVDIVWSTVPCT